MMDCEALLPPPPPTLVEYVLDAGHYCMCFGCIGSLNSPNYTVRLPLLLHRFIDEDTETQKGYALCPTIKWLSWDLNPGWFVYIQTRVS